MAEMEENLFPEKERILTMHALQHSLEGDGKSFKGW